MKPRSGPAALLGLLALSAFAYAVLVPFLLSAQDAEPTPGQLLINLGASALILALVAYFMIYASRSARVPLARKNFWRRVLLFGNVFAMPVFWYLYVWQEAPASPDGDAASRDPEARLSAILRDYQAKRQR